MPRTYAKLFVEVWAADSDFRDLSADAQRLYWLLCSQDELTSAGVLPVRTRRWSNFASDTTEAQIKKSLDELTSAKKVYLDEDTEELLVRSFIRRDEGWRTPNIRKSVERAIANIESDALRDVAEYELTRAIAEHHGEPFTKPFPEPFGQPIDEPQGEGASIEHTSPTTCDLPPSNDPLVPIKDTSGAPQGGKSEIENTISHLSERFRA